MPTSFAPFRLAFLAALAFALSPAAAEEPVPTHIRGTIAAIEGSKLTLAGQDGTKTILRLGTDAKIFVASKASLVDVVPGAFVGVANTGPNGLQDALEVHIWPGAMRGAHEGQSRWDLGSRSRMTTGIAGAKAESYDGQELTLTYASGESTIQVRPNTPVVKLSVGSVTDLKSGAGVFVRDGETQPDGSVLTDAVIVGRDEIKPPM